jgi:hypothetical protein
MQQAHDRAVVDVGDVAVDDLEQGRGEGAASISEPVRPL